MGNDGVIGLLSFLSFGFSVIAAVLAIDTYALLRTGQSGGTWRVLIIASVIFALMHALRLSELLNFAALNTLHLSEIVELVFVIALTYAFYLQRRIFQGKPARTAKATRDDTAKTDDTENEMQTATSDDIEIENDTEPEIDVPSHEWARLNGLSTSDFRYSRGDTDDDAVALHDRRSTERRSSDRRAGDRRNR